MFRRTFLGWLASSAVFVFPIIVPITAAAASAQSAVVDRTISATEAVGQLGNKEEPFLPEAVCFRKETDYRYEEPYESSTYGSVRASG